MDANGRSVHRLDFSGVDAASAEPYCTADFYVLFMISAEYLHDQEANVAFCHCSQSNPTDSMLTTSSPLSSVPHLLVVLALGLLVVPEPTHAQQKKIDAATTAAQSWLKLLDAGDYAATWTKGAKPLQSKMPKKKWAQHLKTKAHKDLGAVKSRSLSSTTHKSKSSGEYVVAKYKTQYGSKTMLETVTVKNTSSAWKVAGYFIKPAP